MLSIALIPATKVVPGVGHAEAMIIVPSAGNPAGWSSTPEKIIPRRTEMNMVTTVSISYRRIYLQRRH